MGTHHKLALIASGFLLPLAAVAQVATSTTSVPGKEPSLLFLADSQFHNVYGAPLKQMSQLSGKFSRVAQRTPELNLLAPLALEELLQQGLATGTPGNRLALYLGDATNIACSGELDNFYATMDGAAKQGAIWLMAHGNHDSYMLGTLSYFPGDYAPQATPMAGDGLPPDRSWWPTWENGQVPGRKSSWGGACFDPTGSSRPLNKPQWLRRYLGALERQGVVLDRSSDAPSIAAGHPLALQARAGTPLAQFKYEIRGTWFAEDPERWMAPYESFMVQKLDLSPSHRLLLIDTSVCTVDLPKSERLAKGPGVTGCLTPAQLDVIEAFAAAAPHARLTIAGHHPLAHIGDSARLAALLARRPDSRYVSAHTHDPYHRFGQETNIGSTTDWPMEAQVLDFVADGPNAPPQRHSYYAAAETRIVYEAAQPTGSWWSKSSEACRHLAAAEALADLDLIGADPFRYKSPPQVECAKDSQSWQATGERLRKAIARIHQRAANEPDYRRRLLDIAGAASYHTSRKPQLADFIP
jgi:hypothetical protein